MSEWVEAPLSQLATFQKGRKVDTSPFNGDGYAPYLGASGLEGGDDGFAATPLAVIAKSTDTLMLWDGERSGLVGYGRQGVVASTVSKLSPSDKVEPKYLYYALSERFDWIQHRRTGTGVPHVPKDLGRLLKLRYPKQRTIQQRIATILTGIDTAIEKTEALIAKYQQIKAGLMHDLFTRGVLPNGQLRPPREQAPDLYQETAIGWIPREWDVKPLGHLCEMTSGGTPSRSIPAYWGGSIPWLKTGEIKYEDISRTEEYITTKGLGASSAKVFPAGTIVMAMYGEGVTRGRVAILAVPCASNQACIGFSFSNQIQTKYMYHFFEHCYEELRDLSNDGSQKNLSSGLLKQFQIRFPTSKTEQDCIADRLSKLDQRIASEKTYLQNLCQQKLGLMHDLLSGKVPVTIENRTTTTEAVA